MIIPRVPVQHRRLLPDRRLSGPTPWVIAILMLLTLLAAAAGVAPSAIGFCGLKDRHAVTRQAFSVHLPGRDGPDWSALAIDGMRVLSATRHGRKLKRG